MEISIRKLFFFLLITVFVLLVMNFYPYADINSLSGTIHNRFNLDAEANIPTWFSTLLLFCVSLTSFILYNFRNKLKIDTSMHTFWLVMSAAYCFLSLDEAARIHEVIDAILHIKWIYIYAPLAGIFFMTCVYFLVIINKDVNSKNLRNWIIGGLLIYALGGLGGETYDYFVHSSSVEVVFEEGLEFLGTIMVLIGSLQELERRHKVMCDHLDPSQSELS